MAYLTQQGLSATDDFTNLGRLIFSHPAVPHSLVLFGVADEGGYQPAVDGWRSTDGRSGTGGIRIAGGYTNPVEELQCTFYATPEQVRLFDWLKRAQDNSADPITVEDWIQKISQPTGAPSPNWLAGSPVVGPLGINEGYQSFVCWIDTDRGYKSYSAGNCWLILQFQALREV
jgi:hypothetical protein